MSLPIRPVSADQSTIVFTRRAGTIKDAISISGIESQELIAGGSIFVKREVSQPGAKGLAHYHPGPTAIYVISGRIRVDFGPQLEFTEYAEPGDAYLIPAGVVHSPSNDSETEVAECLVIRDTEAESVIPVPQG